MAEIMLALGRDFIKPFYDLDPSEVSGTYGVKILTNEMYRFGKVNDTRRMADYPATARFARYRSAQRIMIDARVANDTKSEVAEAVNTIVSEVITPPPAKKVKIYHKLKKPEFISAGVDMTQGAMETFVYNCGRLGVNPVVHLTSSRFTEQDFENRGTTAEKNAIWRTKLAMNSGFETGAVICAAADAEVVKNTNPDFFVFATGAMLADSVDVEPVELRHERPALIEDTSEFVDVYLIGAPIFHAGASSTALQDRISIARG